MLERPKLRRRTKLRTVSLLDAAKPRIAAAARDDAVVIVSVLVQPLLVDVAGVGVVAGDTAKAGAGIGAAGAFAAGFAAAAGRDWHIAADECKHLT